MARCVECGEEFDISDAREYYNWKFNDNVDYDDQYPEGNMCGYCAVRESRWYMDIGSGMINE